MFNFLKKIEGLKNPEVHDRQVDTNLDWKKELFNRQELIGDKDQAIIKDVTIILSDPEYIKTFGVPSDGHYEFFKQGFSSSLEQVQNEVAFLEDFFKKTDRPLFSLLRYTTFLKTVIGQLVSVYVEHSKDISIPEQIKQQERTKLQVLFTYFKKLKEDPETPYLLAKSVDPDYIMEPYHPFEKWRDAVSPTFITDEYAVVDSGAGNTFHLLKIPSSDRAFVNGLVDRYEDQAKLMDPRSRPQEPKEGASLRELIEYKKRHIDPMIHGGMNWGLPKEMEKYVIPIQERAQLFPHLEDWTEIFEDELVFESRSFFKKGIRDEINKDLQINLNNLSFQEQIYFLTYVAKKKNSEFQEIKDFTRTYREDGLRTFLSLASGGPEMGQKILDIGEKLPAESANAIFKKYAEFVDATQEIEFFIANEFNSEFSKNQEIVNQVREKLLSRGVNVIKNWGDTVQVLGLEGSQSISLDDVISDLDKISADAIATLSIFKFARKQGFNLSLEDIKNSEFRNRKIEDISESERQEMINIYRENYSDKPELAEKLINQFRQAFEYSDKNEFYTYRLNGKLNAFLRFEERGDGKFASALNIQKESQGFSLGEAMMEQALSREAQDYILYAEANLAEWNTSRYMELGFNAVSENTKYVVPAVNIVWDNAINEKYLSKKLSIDEIFSGHMDDNSIIIETYHSLSDFDRSRLGEHVMTRSVFNKEEGVYYVVLEKNRQKNT